MSALSWLKPATMILASREEPPRFTRQPTVVAISFGLN
jgi:hypothetical protein